MTRHVARMSSCNPFTTLASGIKSGYREPEHLAVMGMASGVATLGRRVLAGGVRRLLWTVMTSAVATSVGQISHATFCGTARPLTHDHHSRAPLMVPDSPVMFPDAFATLSWPRIES